ncbi:MAG: pyridoxal-phosphate dependent enzyme [Raineya sp.]
MQELLEFSLSSAWIETLSSSFFGREIDVLRLDKIHPLISGNKWFKLKYNILEAKKQQKKKLLTFGGAYSNHIVATAAAGNMFDFETIGIIRGEELGGQKKLNPYLQKATALGMHLHFVSREAYRQKKEKIFIEKMQGQFGEFYLLPEGGSNVFALQGTTEILNFLKTENVAYDYICACVGTGGTLAGIAASLAGVSSKILGFSVLKNAAFLYEDTHNLLLQAGIRHFQPFEIILDYHFGGYAKQNATLLKFIQDFSSSTNIPIEPIYTGKLFFGVKDLLEKGYFPVGSKILLIHCGGVLGL